MVGIMEEGRWRIMVGRRRGEDMATRKLKVGRTTLTALKGLERGGCPD